MLSILVCSVKPILLSQLQKNVEETIGIPYELLYFDNRIEKKGLCTIYNILARKAKYSILCFIHEDILFFTENWGKILYDLFLDANVGAIGVAGSKYKSAVFSGWFTGEKAFDCANISHRLPGGDVKISLRPKEDSKLEEVVCLDGVFIACRKSLWADIKFDEANLKGFHLYDLDFSLRASQKTSLFVTYDIDLVHITEGGDFTNNWIDTSINFHLRYKEYLPIPRFLQPEKTTELRIAKNTLDFLKPYSISLKNKLKWIGLQNLFQHPTLYYAIIKFLLYQPLGLKYLHKYLIKTSKPH